MDNLDSTLAEKAQENLEAMQLLIEGMRNTDSDEKRMELIVHFMHIAATNRRILSEALTDDEIQMVKDDMGDKWNLWKKANTAEGAMDLLKYYNEEKDN